MKYLCNFELFLTESIIRDKSPLDNNKVDPQGFGLAYDCLDEIKTAVDNNQLKIREQSGLWRKYRLDINILRKEVNTVDGYLIDAYIESADGHEIHLGEIRNGDIYPNIDNESYNKFMSEKKQIDH